MRLQAKALLLVPQIKYFPHMVHRFFDLLWSLLILYNFVLIPYTTFLVCSRLFCSSSFHAFCRVASSYARCNCCLKQYSHLFSVNNWNEYFPDFGGTLFSLLRKLTIAYFVIFVSIKSYMILIPFVYRGAAFKKKKRSGKPLFTQPHLHFKT